VNDGIIGKTPSRTFGNVAFMTTARRLSEGSINLDEGLRERAEAIRATEESRPRLMIGEYGGGVARPVAAGPRHAGFVIRNAGLQPASLAGRGPRTRSAPARFRDEHGSAERWPILELGASPTIG
jgi:hypothetical protein